MPRSNTSTRAVSAPDRWFRAAVGIIGGVFLGWLALASAGATGGFLVDVWDSERGLPNSSVTTITQTPDGYLWLGTYNGLVRFNGLNFEVFDPLNTPALPHPRIQELFVDADGTLWINTYDGSLVTYREGRFRLEHKGPGPRDVRIRMVSSTAGEIAFSTQLGELLRRSTPMGEWEVFRPEPSPRPTYYVRDGQGAYWWLKMSQGEFGRLIEGDPPRLELETGLGSQRASVLAVGPDGRLWIGTDQQVVVWDGERFDNVSPTNGEPQLDVAAILPLRDGGAWVLANGRMRKQVGRAWVAEDRSWEGLLGWSAARAMGAHEDRQGGVWFNHYGNGLFHVSPEGEFTRLTIDEGLPGDRVGAWFEDREGNIWVGADRGGLVRIRPRMFQVIGEAEGLPARAVISVSEDSTGVLWMGTFGGGVHFWKDGVLRSPSVRGLQRMFVFSLCPRESGALWMSSGAEDLYILQGERLERAPWDAHGVKVLLADGQGRLWAGLKDGVGYWSEEESSGVILQEGFASAAVRTLAEGPDGSIWFGSDDGSLYQFHTNGLTRFRPSDELASQPIWSLLVDADGTVWAGTFRGGLLRFKDGGFTRYTVNEGLPSDVISQLLDDGMGRLWCGSHQGIFHVAFSSFGTAEYGESRPLDCVAYGKPDGLPTLECSGNYNPACLRSKDGRLWFATVKGLVSVRPDAVAVHSPPPPVVIEEWRVDGVKQPMAVPLTEGVRWEEPVIVPPGRTQFRFLFSALSLAAPDKVRFRHKLEGHDPDWIEAGTRREAIYTSLRPGTYQFKVMASGRDGVWSERTAALPFVLKPFFYETWWFYGALGLGTALVFMLTVRWLVTRRLRRELALVEQHHAIERDRARIANDIHDDLGAGLTEISLLSELAQRDRPENLPGYLNQIASSARSLGRVMDEVVWAVNPANDTLEELMTYVSKLAQDYLGVAGIRCRLDVPPSLPPIWIEAEKRHHLFLAIKEALNNVVKHARATEVSLSLSLQSGGFTIVIEDNGRGIEAAAAEGDSAQPARLQSGHGLPGLKKRLAEIGGACRVTSETGKGTRVELSLVSSALSPKLASGTPRDPK